jgi:predicted secreted hydrolase
VSARPQLAVVGLMLCMALRVGAQEAPSAPAFAPVIPGYALRFPRDYGSHPQFRIEWWYVTGWLTSAKHETLGFQITFFRIRPAVDEPNPSHFAAHQLLIAHCAISDPAHAKLWHEQRVRRAGLGLAEAQESDTRVWIDDWALQRQDGSYRARASAQDFRLDLTLTPTQPPLLNGADGFSRKGPQAQAASYYYSQPHLRVSGGIVRASGGDAVSGEAWLDHEWSSDYLAEDAAGWDWLGLNLDDGSAVMAFRIRDRQGHTYWSAASVRAADGATQSIDQQAIEFTVQRRWRSPHTGVSYPVSEMVGVGARRFELEPLLDDQENDTRLTSGAIYWEGAVTALENQRPVGRGYLELTGYDRPLSWR